MNEVLKITVLDPKVKGILKELQNLDLIKIDEADIKAKKQEMIDKLEGMNLKDVDPDFLDKIVTRR
ncbi:hypothetical protein N9B82_01820 [Saprospiraceae bacterium]|nr:hypothetical protein [Saprospiraceae bacterium]